MINPVQALNAIENYESDELEKFLEKLQIVDVFEILIKTYRHNAAVLRQITKYIVYTYTLESEYILFKGEWGDCKKQIFEFVMLEGRYFNEVVKLESTAVCETVARWLDYQDNEVYTELVRLQDLKKEFHDSLLLPIDECSYNQKFENACNAQKLTIMISELRSQLIQNSEKLKSGAIEVRTYRKKNTIGPEKFAHHVRQEGN